MRFGRYELLERLGAGGMAEVFLAERRGPRGVAKRLVIKRIAPARAADPRFVALFEQEARVGCDLSHGNLVSVFELGRVGDHWFIAMEHVDGRDLGAVLAVARARGVAVPAEIAARIGADVCRGLAHVHARGYVHRDVTPRNVLVSWDGQVKLSDYGVALAADDGDGAVRGTPRYMAPEQAAGGPVDARTDVYALGVVLAQLGPTGALAAIVERATAAAPADRFASADDLRAALEQIAAGADERDVAAFLASLRAELGAVATASAAATATAARAPAAPPRTDAPTASTASALDPFARLEPLFAAPRRSRRRRWRPAALAVLAAAGAVAAGLALTGDHTQRAPELPARCSYGEGYYCGAVLRQLGVADALEDMLYVCRDDRAVPHEACTWGCVVEPVGHPDVCRVKPPHLRYVLRGH